MSPKKTILVVDDSLVARMFIRKNFENDSGWQILEAENSTVALQVLEKNKCDIISIDYNMPEGNGMELIDNVLKLYPSVKVAMLTANIQNSLRQAVEKKGVVFLEKPITEKTIESLKKL